MIINGTEIRPGEEKKVDVNIATLPSHAPINISMTISRATEPGPVLLLMGGLHGDEINGIEIVRRIVEQGLNKPLCGTTICLPILNVFGFIHFSRYVPDGKDVNRSFPGSKSGSLASRVAYYMTKDILPEIDYGLDFHTGGADRTNYPQIRAVMKDTENKLLADVFHAPFTIDSKFRVNSLRWSANRLGKKILVYEGGESSRFDEFAIKEGINGTRRVMRYLKMCSEAEEPKHVSQLIKSSTWIRASNSGIFLSTVKYGQKVEKKQIIGHISDPFGEFKKEVRSPFTGYVIGLNHNPILHQGDAVVHVGAV